MKRWAVELAQEFKKRDNTDYIGAIAGTVLSINPLKIGISNNEIILDSSHLYICSNLVEGYNRKVTLGISDYTAVVSATDSHGDAISSMTVSNKTDYDATLAYKDILSVDDKVLVIAAEDNQSFFIVDKLI